MRYGGAVLEYGWTATVGMKDRYVNAIVSSSSHDQCLRVRKPICLAAQQFSTCQSFLGKVKTRVIYIYIFVCYDIEEPGGSQIMAVHERISIAAITGIFPNRSSPAKVLDTGTSCIIQDLRVYIIRSLYGYMKQVGPSCLVWGWQSSS